MAHIVVVGGTRGLGKALAIELAAAGDKVSVLGRRLLPDGPRLRHWAVDLVEPGACEQAVTDIMAAHGPWHGAVFLQRFRGNGDDFTGNLEIGLAATHRLIRALVPNRGSRTPRSIVLVGSHAARLVAIEQSLGYHVAKAGLSQMTRFLAVELGPRGVRVNSVIPGSVVKEEAREYYTRHPELVRLVASVTPLGRMGTPTDVIAAIRFLLGPGAAFVTGHELVVDGGASLVLQESLARRVGGMDKLPVTREARRRRA